MPLSPGTGECADAILALVDNHAFDTMMTAHSAPDSAKSVFALIKPETIRLRKNKIIKSGINVPAQFACRACGTFKPTREGDFSKDAFLAASNNLEDQYLSESTNIVEHFVAQADGDTYSEVVFGKTLG